MTTRENVAPEGRRARKRRETENAIEISAVELALEFGFEAVTVEQICDRADIARSTFFNYFPSRDAAIVGRPIEVITGEDAQAILAAFPTDLPKGLFALLFASIGHMKVNSEVVRLRQRLTAEQPAARRPGTAALLLAGDHLVAEGAAWLLAHPDLRKLDTDPLREAVLSASTVYAAVTGMAGAWATESGDIETGLDQFDEAIADLRTILA